MVAIYTLMLRTDNLTTVTPRYAELELSLLLKD